MKPHRIYAILIRYLYLFRHSFDRLSDAFYWPTIDLFVWGLTSKFFQQYSSHQTSIIAIVASGIIFWYIIWRAQYEMTVNLLEDLWDRNLINIFVAPLKFSEWITSFIILGIVKATISLIFTAFLAFILYKFHIFVYGFYLLPFIALLLMTGWAVGLFVTGIILRFGTRIQTLAWAMVAVISPFSVVYYPLSVLPLWAQKVASFVPSSYVFEGMREVLAKGTLDPEKLYISFLLNLTYLILAFVFLRRSFAKVLQKGLINLE